MSELLRERLVTVAALRREKAMGDIALAKAQAELDELPEAKRVAVMRLVQHGLIESLAEAEATAKKEALAKYGASGSKGLPPGVTVKVFQVVEYDPSATEYWCRFNAVNLLTLDAKRFERGIKDGTLKVPPDVAQVVPEHRAQLASDLREYEL